MQELLSQISVFITFLLQSIGLVQVVNLNPDILKYFHQNKKFYVIKLNIFIESIEAM